MLGFSIIIGFNGALNTLVSQAAGAGNIDLCLMYKRRCKIVMSLCFIPVIILMWNSDSILIAIG
jgi:Na+-driven multidrug efflux pump